MHTHILEGKYESFVVYSTSDTLDWNEFLYYYEMGDEYPVKHIPSVFKYYDIKFLIV
tara:strand:- start:337 stop:507 length:171 start_codon:yes stop_codon:yes gene_type:complete